LVLTRECNVLGFILPIFFICVYRLIWIDILFVGVQIGFDDVASSSLEDFVAVRLVLAVLDCVVLGGRHAVDRA